MSSDRFARSTKSGSFSGTHDLGNSASTSTGRRRKSRSPNARGSEISASRVDGPGIVKRRSGSHHLSSTTINVPNPQFSTDEMSGDRGRKSKSKLPMTTHSRFAIENTGASIGTGGQLGSHSGALRKERERSKSRDGHSRARKHEINIRGRDEPQVETQSNPSSTFVNFSEFKRMQKELESFKKLAHDNKKTMKKQTKLINELTAALSNETKAKSDRDDEMRKLKTKSKKNDDLLTCIETNMMCQICMEVLHKPYALAPCGHILCLLCLQEWFRQAPADDDEMYDEDDPDFLLHRRKTCPCCRTAIRLRPIPVFLVKTIATAIARAKGSLSLSRSNLSSSPTDDDPWEGLFPATDDLLEEDDGSDDDGEEEDDEDDEDDDDDDDDDDDGEDDDGSEWAMDIFGYGSDSDDEHYEGDYVPARWEPPTVHIEPDDYMLSIHDGNIMSMLRRGATIGMIASYQMEYNHAEGLSATVDDNNSNSGRVYLGWSVNLNPEDLTGKDYMDWVLSDITERPERWDYSSAENGGWVARKLVPLDDIFAEYNTTDSEVWFDD